MATSRCRNVRPESRGWHCLAVAAIAALSMACSGSTGPDRFAVPAHRAEWEAQHIASYQYDYLVTGYFISYEGKPIRIVVRDGEVQSAAFIADTEPLAEPAEFWPTIAELFDRAERASAAGALSGIRYDSLFHFPAEIDISGPPDASGSLFVTNLHPFQ